MDNPFLPKIPDIVNKILYQLMNNYISDAEARELLGDLPPAIKDEWISDIFNRLNAVANFVDTSQYSVYPENRPERHPIMERIREAARRYCNGETVRHWRSDATERAIQGRLCEDFEIFTFDRMAKELRETMIQAGN